VKDQGLCGISTTPVMPTRYDSFLHRSLHSVVAVVVVVVVAAAAAAAAAAVSAFTCSNSRSSSWI